MKYEKPQVVVLASAIKAVQGIQKNGRPMDSLQPTVAAYEADE